MVIGSRHDFLKSESIVVPSLWVLNWHTRLGLEPSSNVPFSLLAASYARIGNRDSAQTLADRLLDSTARPLPGHIGQAAQALAASGRFDEASAFTARLDSLPTDTWQRWTGLALACAGLGDTVKMIDAMAHAAGTSGGDEFPVFAAHRLIGELPSGPRIESILRRYHVDPRRFVKRNGDR